MTNVARALLQELQNLLTSSLLVDYSSFFERFINESDFDEPLPVRVTVANSGAEPCRTDTKYSYLVAAEEPDIHDQKYIDRLGILARLFLSKDKQLERRQIAYAADRSEWEQQNARFEEDHTEWRERTEAEYDADADYRDACIKWGERRDLFLAKQGEQNEWLITAADKYRRGELGTAEYCLKVLYYSVGSFAVTAFKGDIRVNYAGETRTLIVEVPLPAPGNILLLCPEYSDMLAKQKILSKREAPALYDSVIYQLVLRYIYELFATDHRNALDAVIFNGTVTSLDMATGRDVTACIVSLHTNKDEFMAINFSRVDPKTCFKALKGIGSSKLHGLTPVAPIQSISREDKRFIDGQEVADTLDSGTNLAAMDWEEFEHLIREVFSWEFCNEGSEVRVTQSSRDGGVDAVVIDSDPIRGGKIVIQAKRYTRTVGVSAVRDLWGTVEHEGALLGILVTTSDYGPDAYEFAKDKRIRLLNGGNLLHLMQKHGHRARIDLSEARAAR